MKLYNISERWGDPVEVTIADYLETARVNGWEHGEIEMHGDDEIREYFPNGTYEIIARPKCAR